MPKKMVETLHVVGVMLAFGQPDDWGSDFPKISQEKRQVHETKGRVQKSAMGCQDCRLTAGRGECSPSMLSSARKADLRSSSILVVSMRTFGMGHIEARSSDSRNYLKRKIRSVLQSFRRDSGKVETRFKGGNEHQSSNH